VEYAQNADHRTYEWAGATLRMGMAASVAAMLAGFLWWLLSGSPGGGITAHVMPADRVLPELLALNPLALVNLGVLLLLATPSVALAAQLVSFALARNWRYTAITAVIGAIILVSIGISMGWLRLG
jgi:uncharacterized membrane protein